jgi:hypothetical protein
MAMTVASFRGSPEALAMDLVHNTSETDAVKKVKVSPLMEWCASPEAAEVRRDVGPGRWVTLGACVDGEGVFGIAWGVAVRVAFRGAA